VTNAEMQEINPPTKNASLAEIEQAKREKLKREKPQVYEKIMKIGERYNQGIATPIIDIAYSYVCNLSCEHCTAWRGRWMRPRGARILTPTDLRRISDEAHSLGWCQFCISGGEPTVFKDLDDVILALQPDKFHLTMSTHGHFLTKEKAKHYKSLGLDKVKISLDDFDPKLHDANRHSVGSYNKAIAAMFNAKEAGLSVVIQTVVTRQNCQTPRILEMAKFAQENDFSVDILVARPTGAWEGRYDMLINQQDAEYLWKAHQQYPVLHRDVWPAYGLNKGSGAVHSTLHITQYGDVMPCVYIHIAIGNVFTGTLAEAVTRGQTIKWFKNFSPICLSGEDRYFIENYMAKAYGKELPIPWTEAFSDEDFVK
jgi:MoaA/NifB/PqqE/SkfB family radical SAM enzyme